jgi:hypothetical protein
MDNACKQLFFGLDLYPTISCSIWKSLKPNTWKHALLSYKQQYIHTLRIKRHNKVVWEIQKLLIQSNKSRCFTLINADTFNTCSLENIVLPYLVLCTYFIHCYTCSACLQPNILCVQGIPYKYNPPTNPDPNITI